MLTYTIAMIFLLITPGPGVLTVAGVGAGFGFRAGVPYALGIVAGSHIVTALVVSGVAAAAFAIPNVRNVLLALSTAYLLYLAMRIALAGNRIGFIEAQSVPNFANGAVLSAINPKGYAVLTTVFSGFAIYPENFWLEVAVKVAIMLAIQIPVHLLWLAAGATLKQLAPSPGVARTINIAMALAMVAVVALAVFSAL